MNFMKIYLWAFFYQNFIRISLYFFSTSFNLSFFSFTCLTVVMYPIYYLLMLPNYVKHHRGMNLRINVLKLNF